MSEKRFSRKTVVNACALLRATGHADFDHLLLAWGVDGLNADRAVGGLQARANAVVKFALANPVALTAEGEQLQSAIVRRAAKMDPHYPDGPIGGGITDDERNNFWDALGADGYQNAEGNIVAIDKDPLVGPPLTEKQASETPEPRQSAMQKPPTSRKVFLVHGRDHASKSEVARYLERIGLEAIILHERPNKGRTLISKFREESEDIGFAVVLMTPDDEGHLKGDAGTQLRARQNVVFELGFFIGKLGPERVCALVASDLEKPSDFDAVVYVPYGQNTSWQTDLARELRAAGIPFDPGKVF